MIIDEVNYVSSLECQNESEVEAFLAHHGIKGMKWGHRKQTKQLTRRQQQRKKVRKDVLKAGSKETVVLFAGLTALQAGQMLKNDPEMFARKMIPAARFLGKSMRVSMKVVSKASKGAKLLFGKDGSMTYFPPGKFHPGNFASGGPLQLTRGLRALTTGGG